MEKAFTHKNNLLPLLCFFSFILFSVTSPAQWARKADGIVPRSEVVSVDYKGKIYVFFGFRDSLLREVEPSAEVYDPSTNTWQLLDSVPAGKAATHTGVAQLDDMVWHVGGRVGRNPGPLTSEIWIYHINTNTWRQGPTLLNPATGKPLPWAAGGAAFVGRTLHVFGGFINTACENDQSTYHLTLDVDEWLANPSKPAKWKNVLAPMPVKRNHLATVVLAGKIYAIGGQFGHDCGGAQDQQYSHVYNTATNTWTELPQLPAPRSHTEGSTFAIDGKIYVVGGQALSPTSSLVTIFDPATNNGAGAWRNDSDLTLPLTFETLSAKVIGTTFILSHGGQPRYNNPRKATYTRTISRTPVYKFGFLPTCSNLTVNAGTSAKARTLLFTIDGSKDYTLSSNASWLTVTKNATGTAIQNAVDVEVTIKTAGLASGSYKGIITVTGTGSGPAYTGAQYCVNLTVSGSTASTTLEAENAVLYRAVVAKNHAGYTGSGFADYINASGDYVEWTVNQSSAAPATLQFRYANGSTADRPLKVEVNGKVVKSSLSFPPTGGWTNWSTVSVAANLNSGANKVRLTAIGSSGANVDHLAVWPGTMLSSIAASPQIRENFISTALPKDFNVSVAPNPASGMVKLLWNNISDALVEVRITDASGIIRKAFVTRNSNNGQFDFTVSDLPDGFYIIFAKQGNEQASAKLLVKKN
jgi:hypothetical protein